ncbi:DNA alkylation repair protein [Leptospira ognonensis]|uniref:DNA alkylation repair protein n=1 Tax=Leptospira ognonensis TaxID=2484945 RepID=A0A4R9JZ24_9LEPT|nr:DNA alkylation repair protein [Leptospira ognonensis]TGL58522.1 DNA alkylation repair protein [Leptospira ognonensis]
MVLTEKNFLNNLKSLKSAKELPKVKRYFTEKTKDDKFIGIRMAAIFKLAKQYSEMEHSEVLKLLRSEFYEARMGAVSIMDFQARKKNATSERKKALFEMYIHNHQWINNWDLIDRSAPYVIGGYLYDKPRNILYKLAKSKNIWERRTAIVSTYFFIRQNDLADTFKIAEILRNDQQDLIQRAVGSWIREAGKNRFKNIDI